MDCYKSESEFIDSLDFLSPPVKRISSRDLFGCSYNGEPNNIQLFRGIRRKFTPKDKVVDEKEVKKATRTVKIGGASSTSLILKKTSERKILQRYTVVSYTSLHSSNLNTTSPRETCARLETKDKPLIKVTVIPKSDQVQTAKLLGRRRSVPKRVQSTSSNHENSVKTKNLYLVVAGRRNKIYEIKTTGSATCSSDQTDHNYSKHDIAVEGFSNVKHLIQSLNMDQKQRNYKREFNVDGLEKATSPNMHHETSSYASKGIDPYECEGYTYSSNLESGKRPLNRSRVRIYGQLGLTEDDRYVLRYGATVNDKPVTDFTQLTQDFLPQALPRSRCNTYKASPEVTKEVSVQATYGSCNRNQQHVVAGVLYSKESQGTQVNFNITTDPRYCCKAIRADKDIQCNCNHIAEDKLFGGKSEINDIKETHSPLVIISVYPKQNTEETYKYSSCAYRRPVTHTSANVQYVSKLQVNNSTDRRIIESKADEGLNRKIVESKVDEVINRRIIEPKADEGQNRKYMYVSKSQVDGGTNRKIVESKIDEVTNRRIIEPKADEGQNRKYIPPMKKYNKRPPRSRSPSPVKNTSKGNVPQNQTEATVLKTQPDTASDRNRTMRVIKNKTLEKDSGRSEAAGSSKVQTKPVQRSKSPMKRNPGPRSQEKGTITDHAKAKKNLVENYTKQLTGQMSHRDQIPARIVNSKVTIDIEGEQECYNVLFDQSKLSTDLRVSKTMKNMNSQKCCNRDAIPTFENLLILPKQNFEAQSASITRDKDENDKQLDENSKNRRFSGMTIRDSLEISHRREDKHGCDVTSTRNCIPAHCIEDLSNNPQWLAPIKHYTGDDCSICDPVERDKQIRILLGVDKSKYSTPTSLQAHSSENEENQCLYPRECEKNQKAEFNLLKYCPILGSLSSKIGGKSCCCNNVLSNTQLRCWPNYGADEAALVIKQGNDKTILSSVHKEQNYVHKQQTQGLTGNNASSTIYQQLILNRNIQIFLQVEQFSKRKPIILSRKQYDKVKKTIQTTLNHRCKCKEKRKNPDTDVSDISVGEMRQRRNKNIQLHFDQEIQTDWIWGKNNFQKSSKRPRMVSKVRYMVRAPRSKIYRERQQDKDTERDEDYAYENADGCYQIYPQKERHENLQICQGTCQTVKTIQCSRNYEYYTPSEQYFQNQRRRQYEVPDSYSRHLKKNKRQCDYHIPNATVDKKKSKEYGKHKSNENFCLHSGEQRKHIARHCKERKEYAKVHEKKHSENGEHRRFINKCYNSNGTRPSDDISLNKENKECCIEIKEKQNSNNDKSMKVTEQDKLNEKCNKDDGDQEIVQSTKNCIESEAIYAARHQSINQENRAGSDNSHKESEPFNIQNIIEHAIANRIHHRECGEYNTECEPRLMSLPYTQNEEHSLHSRQNSKKHKPNTVKEYPTTKREHHRARAQADRVIEHNETLAERTQPLKRHEVLLRKCLRQATIHDKNVTIDNPCFEDVDYQKQNKESEHKLQETYSRLNAGVQDYFKPDFEGDEYFGQNLEYGRLYKNNDKCNVNTKERSCHSDGHDNQIDTEEQLRTVTLYDAHKQDSLQADHTDQSTKNTVSSLEIHYTKHYKTDLSSSDLAEASDSSLCRVNSIQTIFRGRRKSPTPNLGTSIYSLYSENGLNSNKSTKFIMTPRDVKPNKRPFLRRLMSCLVMRSTRESALKLPTPAVKEMPSVNSSVDSYHISTSLGAVEVSSSIYDTSASFYSNHTILPINSKIKRGFFNSVRGFLTNRRS